MSVEIRGFSFINPDSFDRFASSSNRRGPLRTPRTRVPTLPDPGWPARFPLASYIALLLKTVLRVSRHYTSNAWIWL